MDGLFSGAVALPIGGATARLRFTWGALAELREQYGPDFQTVINDRIGSLDFEALAHLISLGTGRALTPAQVQQASPPIVAAIRAVNEAFNVAYHGPSKGEGVARPLAEALATARAWAAAILSRIASRLG